MVDTVLGIYIDVNSISYQHVGYFFTFSNYKGKRNTVTCTLEMKDKNRRINLKIDIDIFCHVS